MAKKPENELPEINAAGPVVTEPTLSTQEMLELEAQAQEEVQAELKKKLRDEFKKAAKDRLRKKALFKQGEDTEEDDGEYITIDLAKHSLFLNLDGRIFYHGQTYKFSREQAAVVREQMHRTWLHDAEIHGLDMNAFNGRQQAQARISPNTMH